MRTRVEMSSESGIVVVAGDRAEALPAGLDQEALLRHLEPRARSGELFFLAGDDPIAFRIDVYADEPPRPTSIASSSPSAAASVWTRRTDGSR